MENQIVTPPDFSAAGIKHYWATRLSTLKPPPFSKSKKGLNPIPGLRKIDKKTWNFIGVAFFGWTWDAFDFFSVSLTVTNIAESLSTPSRVVTVKDITWGITLVLMLRSVGAAIFGLAADKWGRKWPFIVNCLMFIALELGTGFIKTYEQFLGVRAIFGIAMGGIYGNCAATALEDCPIEARGFISGLLQQGYAFGYLLVVIFSRALVDTTSHGWRPLYWFGSAVPVLIIAWRLCLGETEHYKMMVHERGNLGKSFARQSTKALKTHWLMLVYMVLLMTGMNFMSHGSQDLFPTRLTTQLQYNKNQSTIANSVANIGALCGGIFFGHFSQCIGRRLTLIICCIIGGALVYPWGFSKSFGGINASVFFFQACVQGAWGVIPVHLAELAPVALRTFVVGMSYQLGNLASSAASTIEAKIGLQFPLPNPQGGKGIYDYGKVMAILMGAVFGYVLIIALVGPERRDDGEHEEEDQLDAGIEKASITYADSNDRVKHIA